MLWFYKYLMYSQDLCLECHQLKKVLPYCSCISHIYNEKPIFASFSSLEWDLQSCGPIWGQDPFIFLLGLIPQIQDAWRTFNSIAIYFNNLSLWSSSKSFKVISMKIFVFIVTFMILTSTTGLSRFGEKQNWPFVCFKLSQWKPMCLGSQKVACEYWAFSVSLIKLGRFTEDMESIMERESASFYYSMHFGNCL